MQKMPADSRHSFIPICVSRFAANMGVSRETQKLTKYNRKWQAFVYGKRINNKQSPDDGTLQTKLLV